MDVSIIFKIVAIGILTAVSSMILKHAGKDEMATLVTLAGVIIVLAIILSMISNLFSSIKNLFSLY